MWAIVNSISGLVVEYIVAIDVTRVRFPADAYHVAMAKKGAGAFHRARARVMLRQARREPRRHRSWVWLLGEGSATEAGLPPVSSACAGWADAPTEMQRDDAERNAGVRVRRWEKEWLRCHIAASV